MTNKSKVEVMTFESALSELKDIVKKIDSADETLESSIASFERGVFLKEYCEKKLQEARLRIEKINKSTETSEISVEKVEL